MQPLRGIERFTQMITNAVQKTKTAIGNKASKIVSSLHSNLDKIFSFRAKNIEKATPLTEESKVGKVRSKSLGTPASESQELGYSDVPGMDEDRPDSINRADSGSLVEAHPDPKIDNTGYTGTPNEAFTSDEPKIDTTGYSSIPDNALRTSNSEELETLNNQLLEINQAIQKARNPEKLATLFKQRDEIQTKINQLNVENAGKE